ncbi:hypothetical protein BH23ACT10_BH23ACT10_03480 [soil metagenome]
MLFALQQRGKTTAPELAQLLEVSERTIRRDVDALGAAGVPIYTVQGRDGGIALLDSFRTRLTSLTTEELRVLFLAGQQRLAHRLGYGAPARTVRHKLQGVLASNLSETADSLSDWFLHDPDPWDGNRIPHGELRRLARCIHERREVEVTIGARPVMTVQPLGVVLKAGGWHLVHAADGFVDVCCIDDLRATRITRNRFVPPPDFELSTFWSRWTAGRSVTQP